MPFPDDFPEKCGQCVKSFRQIPNKQCKFCQELKFDESVLCDLNRLMQSSHNFRCHAYQPVLTIVNQPGKKPPDIFEGSKRIDRQESILKYLRSDKIKYKKALALQKMKDDPDGVFTELKYHFAWNVTHRKPVFRIGSDVFDFIYDRSLKYKSNDVEKIDPRYKNGLLKIKPKQTDEEIARDYECGLSV